MSKIILTGGAGFIGSNLVARMLQDDRIELVRVIDNLSNGYYENLAPFEQHKKFQFYKEDIRDDDKMLKLTKGFDIISHQAALGSVPRSIEDPLTSNAVNIDGTLNILNAAVKNKVKQVVMACSSSTYGDHQELPKIEDRIGKPLSPYAVTKYVMELYADVFHKTYGLNYIGLRYFNVFGPNQNPDNPYAAVIPLFCKAFLNNQPPRIFGDGEQSRDFTYVDNAVEANFLAMFNQKEEANNTIYNVACAESCTLNQMIVYLNEIAQKNMVPNYVDKRKGDILHSLADISKIEKQLGYAPQVKMKEGLAKVYQWYAKNH